MCRQGTKPVKRMTNILAMVNDEKLVKKLVPFKKPIIMYKNSPRKEMTEKAACTQLHILIHLGAIIHTVSPNISITLKWVSSVVWAVSQIKGRLPPAHYCRGIIMKP